MFGLQAWAVDFEMADSTDKLLSNCPCPSQHHNHPHNLNGPRVANPTNPNSAANSNSNSAPDSKGRPTPATTLNGGRTVSTTGSTASRMREGGCCSEKPPLYTMDPDDDDDDDDGRSSLMDEVIRLNVGGSVFMTTRSTLDRIPNTRLYNLQESDPNYNPVSGEWFFDRNPTVFNFILDFYRTDELHFPHNLCGPSIRKELVYWNIDECDISSCCWNTYREFEVEKKIFERIERAFESKTLNQYTADMVDAVPNPSKWDQWRRRMYVFLEEPMSSKAAKIWTISFLLVVLASIGILCIETLPSLRVCEEDCAEEGNTTSEITGPSSSSGYLNSSLQAIGHNLASLNKTNPRTLKEMTANGCEKDSTCGFRCKVMNEQTENCKLRQLYDTKPHPALETIDTFCTCFFTVEFLARLIVSPNRIKFWKSIMNIIDVLCVLPMWIRYGMKLRSLPITRSVLPVYFFIMMLRVLRICRVLRLARHYTGVKILLLALKASIRELCMLLIFVFIVVLIFAVVIYYAEFFVNDTFSSIPTGYWWAIITLTTVGYGDEYPKSATGYIVGALCALTGILATGLPVPIIANNFNLYYSHAQLKEAVLNRKQSENESISGSRSRSSLKAITEGNRKEDIVLKEATV